MLMDVVCLCMFVSSRVVVCNKNGLVLKTRTRLKSLHSRSLAWVKQTLYCS